MDKLRVLLAEDHEMVREGLKTLVNAQSDMTVVGEASDGRSAVLAARELQPDVVVMDVSMPRVIQFFEIRMGKIDSLTSKFNPFKLLR